VATPATVAEPEAHLEMRRGLGEEEDWEVEKFRVPKRWVNRENLRRVEKEGMILLGKEEQGNVDHACSCFCYSYSFCNPGQGAKPRITTKTDPVQLALSSS